MAHVVQVWRRRRKWRGDGVLPHWGCWKLAGVRNSEGGSGGGGGEGIRMTGNRLCRSDRSLSQASNPTESTLQL